MAINPLGPQPGQSPERGRQGFPRRDAGDADPHRRRPGVPRRAGQDVWNPEATVIYDAASLPRPSPEGGDLVDVELTGANRIDQRGSWQGAVRDDDLRFKVVAGGRGVRIVDPPDALIVPQSWYAAAVPPGPRSTSSTRPRRCWCPTRSSSRATRDLASTLVQRLIAGPAPDLVDYSHNALPTGADPDISVPVSDDGVAAVDIVGDVTMPGLLDRGLLVAQLAWTLRQVPVGPEPERHRRRGVGHARRPARGQREDG